MLVIARREYLAAVRTKSFLVSLIVLPALMGGSVTLQLLLKNVGDRTEKKFAVVDRTPRGETVAALEIAVKKRNSTYIFDPKTKKQTQPAFILEKAEPSSDARDAVLRQRLELSERVVKGELFGFLEIGPDIDKYSPQRAYPPPEVDGDDRAGAAAKDRISVRYQSGSPMHDAFRRWAEGVIDEAVLTRRFAAKGMTPEQVAAIVQPLPFRVKGLCRLNPTTGAIEDSSDESRITPILVPAGLTAFMFMIIMVGATPLLQGVVEEKMQRIAEVLLGSIRPFEMMMGKLIGMMGVSMTLASVYMAGAYWAAHYFGFSEYLSVGVLTWYLVFQILAVMMYGSLFIAIGAACTDMKETQTMLMPVVLMACLPMFSLGYTIQEPNSMIATWTSFFPFATPMLMVTRLSVPPGPPAWQPFLGVGLVLATTLVCIYAAGRIFRVGILMQGKGAKISELVKWIIQG